MPGARDCAEVDGAVFDGEVLTCFGPAGGTALNMTPRLRVGAMVGRWWWGFRLDLGCNVVIVCGDISLISGIQARV